jgi:tRNA-dihydrouridine synthase A
MPDIDTFRFCVAPMLDWTDRHCRYFMRLMTKRARLYTEMITSPAILHGNRDLLLGFDASEHPVACQLGGSDPEELAKAAAIAAQYGYDEINLNCGCPSERVQKGSFGACLMLEPELVAECFKAVRDASGLTTTVKHRIGVDHQDEYPFVQNFVGTLYEAGCRAFVVHVRTAFLKGLSPRQNRDVPPLKPDYAFALKKEFPEAQFCINGGIATLEDSKAFIERGLDGVMVGRAAYHEPWMLSRVDEVLWGDEPSGITREDVIEGMTEYLHRIAPVHENAVRNAARHTMGLMNGLPGARLWRRVLSDPAAYKEEGPEVLKAAYRAMRSAALADDDI